MIRKLLHTLAIGLLVIYLVGFPHKTVYASFDEGMGFNFGASAAERASFYSKQDPVFKITFLKYVQEYKDACWFCDLFAGKNGSNSSGSTTTYSGGLYDAINVMTKKIFNDTATDFLTLLGIGTLFFILLKVGKILVQFQEVDVMQFLNDLFKPLGRAIIAVAILGVSVSAGHQTIFYMLTNPVLDASLRTSQFILGTTLGDVKILTTGDEDVDSNLTKDLTSKLDWSEINSKANSENSQQGGDQPLEEAARLTLVQWMKSVSSSFIVGIALGGSFVATGLSRFFSNAGLSMTFAGAIIWLGFWLIYLMFPFKLVDAFVRLAFVFALMPLWVILWVFPITQQYTKKAWEMLLSSCFLFIVLSIMIALSLMLISNIVPDKLYSEAGSISRSDFFKLLCSDDKMNQAMEYAGFGSGLCMNAIAFTAMSFSLLSAAASISNSFIGGGGAAQTNVGDGMASTATQAGRIGWSGVRATGQVAALAGSKVHDMWTNRGSRHVSTGTFAGAGTGNSNTGSNNTGGGRTPPPGGGGGGGPFPSNPETPRDGAPSPDTGASYDPTKPAFEQLYSRSQSDVTSKAERQQRSLHIAILRNKPADRQRIMENAGPEERRALENMESAMRNPTITDYGPQFVALREAIAKDILTQNPEMARRPEGEARTRTADGRTAGTPDASATGETPVDTSGMTPERAQAVKELAKDASAPQKFEKLSADVAFVEQSLSTARGRDEFMQAIQNHHDWQSGDSKTMVSFAERMYDANKNGNDVQAGHIVKELLSPHLDNTTAGWNTNGQISAKVETAVKAGGPGRVLSDQLHALSLQITAAQTARPEG